MPDAEKDALADSRCPDGVTCPHPKACWGELACLRAEGGDIPPGAWDDPDPDDPPATRDDDPMWGRDLPPEETKP